MNYIDKVYHSRTGQEIPDKTFASVEAYHTILAKHLLQTDLDIYPAVANPILSMITLLALSAHSSSSAQGPGKQKS